MSTKKPAIGDKGTFYPWGTADKHGVPVRAEIIHVWSNSCVNLITERGDTPTSVLIPEPDAKPTGYYFVPDPVEALIQPKITGYRQLDQGAADMMNRIKALGVEIGALVEELRRRPATAPGKEPHYFEGIQSIDHRWVSIGATDLQTGLMALTRSVAQPSTF